MNTLSSLSFLIPLSLTATGCLSGDEYNDGTADSATAARAIPLKLDADCGNGKAVFVADSGQNSVGDVAAFDTKVNCGAEAVEACWDGLLSRSGDAHITLRQVGDETARCAEDRRIYVDMGLMSNNLVGRFGHPVDVELTANNVSTIKYRADIYPAFEMEYLSIEPFQGEPVPELKVLEFGKRKDVTVETVTAAMGLPAGDAAQQAGFSYVLSGRAATENLLRQEGSGDAVLSVSDIALARLDSLSLLRVQSLGVENTYVIGKTSDGDLAVITLFGN